MLIRKCIGKFFDHISDTIDLLEVRLCIGYQYMMMFGVLFIHGMAVFIFIQQACCFWACYHPVPECCFIFSDAHYALTISLNHHIKLFMNLCRRAGVLKSK